MRGIQKQAVQTILLVMLLAMGVGLSAWYGLHQTRGAITDFEAVNLPEMSTALNLSEGVAQLAALAPYVAGSVKPFQLQTERQRLETRFNHLKKVAANLKNTAFKRDLEQRLLQFRKSLAELIERIEAELFLREDLLTAQFALAELERGDHSASPKDLHVPLNIFSVLDILADQSGDTWKLRRLLLDDMLGRLNGKLDNSILLRSIQNLAAKVIQTRAEELSINRRKAFLLASIRAQSGQLTKQVNFFTKQLQQDVVKQRRRVQSTVFHAQVLMLVIGGFLIWSMVLHYRFNYVMTRDLSLVTQDMLRLAEEGDTDTVHIGIRREDEIGELARAYTVFRDYAIKIKEFSDRLARQTILLETIFNQINDGLSVFSSEGKLVSWNKRFLTIFDLSQEDVYVGRNITELQSLTEREPFEDRTITNIPVDIKHMNTARRARPQTFERRYHSGKIVEFRSQPMPDGGFVTLYCDFTERRAVEAQLHQAQKMEMLGQLTGGVAHDFNNLLAALLTNLQLLSSTRGLSEKQQRYTQRSISVAEKGVSLVQRLSAFSRKQQLFPEKLSINELIVGMMDLIEYSLTPNIAITTELYAKRGVYVDPSQLENALLNLIVNSSAAMPNGGDLVIRTQQCCPAESQKSCVAIIVEDTGLGIPLNIRERVLEPFFTTKPAGQGSGMGLSMVYGFVKQSGGEMQIDSTPGKGTRVTLLLPLAEDSHPLKTVAAAQAVEPIAVPKDKKILLVEDNPHVRQAVAEQIESFGYTAVTAADADSALEQLKKSGSDFGLVITDISLAGPLSGVDLRQELNHTYPEIRIVLTSGLPSETLERHYGLKSDDTVLTKPIAWQTFKRLLS